jgi:methylmalonyl-CoA mutase N-terminal domain/subunit
MAAKSNFKAEKIKMRTLREMWDVLQQKLGIEPTQAGVLWLKAPFGEAAINAP